MLLQSLESRVGQKMAFILEICFDLSIESVFTLLILVSWFVNSCWESGFPWDFSIDTLGLKEFLRLIQPLGADQQSH